MVNVGTLGRQGMAWLCSCCHSMSSLAFDVNYTILFPDRMCPAEVLHNTLLTSLKAESVWMMSFPGQI